MALTLITDPTEFELSKNPVVAEIETDAYISDPGEASLLKIDVGGGSGANAIGGTMSLIWPLDSVIFTIAATPDDSGYQVRPKGVLVDAVYAAQLVEDILKNYKIKENYRVITVGSSISFEALVKSPDYDLYTNFAIANFGYVKDAVTHAEGSAPVYAENYKMRADLWMETEFGSGTFEKKATKELDPLDNKCIFDFQIEINANLEYFIPPYGTAAAANCNSVIKSFYFNYLEKYGSPVLPRQVQKTDNGIVLKGGYPEEDFEGTSEIVTSVHLNEGYFLTQQPRTKKVREAQQEFLSYVSGAGDIFMRVTVTKKDGTVTTLTRFAATVEEYQVIMYPVGFTALATGISFNDIVKYQIGIYITIGGINFPASEIFTYVRETDVFMDEHYLFFTNSRSGFDTLRTTGLKDDSFEIEKETIGKHRLYNTPVTKGQIAEINHQKQDIIKISTGFLTRQQVDWLEDLFLAEEKFIDINGKFIPFTITSSVFKKYDSKSNIHGYEFEILPAFKNRAPKTTLYI